MRTLDRYVLREVLGPVTLGFLVYTFILLMQFLFRSAEMIIRRGVPAEQVGKLLLYTLPNIVVLTIPMAFLFGILVAIGRLASDSELTAMRSSGISLFSLYRPIFALSLLLAAANTLLMVNVLPNGNHALQQLRYDILTSSAGRQVEPRVFYEEWEGIVLYVFDAPAGQSEWHGVFLAEDLPSSENQVTVARRGEIRHDEASDRLVLHLEDALIHKMDFNQPHKYNITRFDKLERVLVDSLVSRRTRSATSKGLREMNLQELRYRAADPDVSDQLRRLAQVEIQKKFSIPAACVVFGLLALPLGFTGGRVASRSTGFAVSAGVIMLYYILLNNGEEAARVGKMAPWLAMWLPNALLTLGGLFMLARKNSDKSLLLGRLDRWFRSQRRPKIELFRRRDKTAGPQGASDFPAGAAATRGPHLVLRLPRFRLRFPNILDRYVVKIFSVVILLVLLSGVTLYIVADLSERVDDIIQNQVSSLVILDYYKYLSLQVIYEIAPMAVLVTTLIVYGLLSRSNEITASKALGISLYRLAVPAVISAAVVAALCAALSVQILPASNERVAQLKDQIRGADTVRTYRRADRQWLFGQGRYIYNFLNYEPTEKSLHRLQVFEFDDSTGDLERRLFTDKASFLGDDWRFDSGWVRDFVGMEVEYEPFAQPVTAYFPETPDYFESEYKLPNAMTYVELRDYIEEIESSGQSAPELVVELHSKIAFPVNSVVLALVALPFSFRLGRRGALYGIGIGVALGMVFVGFLATTTTLGETGALPPGPAVWSPAIAFALLSIYMLLGVKS